MSLFFSKYLYILGAKIRNPNLKGNLSFLNQSKLWNVTQLRDYQLTRCQQLLKFANQHSKFYSNLFSKACFSPAAFKCLGQLEQLPIITKQDLLEKNAEIHTNKSYSFNKLFISETSGSTGQPLMFMKDEGWDSWTRATMFRGLSWYGVCPWDRNGYFWGYNIGPSKALKTKVLDSLQNRFRTFTYSKEALVRFIHKLENATYLQGYSSMIYEVARIINNSDIDTSRLNLKLIKGTSEKIYDHYHAEVKKAFGQKIVSEYGAAEAGVIAFECPYGCMHLNMEGCIVEEKMGEIIVTNLNSYSFPVIRYRLGDSIILEDEKYACPCGMAHRVLREVTGRVGTRIYGYKQIYPSLTIYYVFKNIYMESGVAINAQFVQDRKGYLIVKVEGLLSSEGRSLLEKELYSYFGEDMDWNFEENSVVHTMDGKRKDFISLIDNV